ncbi:MAG: hypothetical protein ACREJX_22220, partial [Polyangiaceae bacterium]
MARRVALVLLLVACSTSTDRTFDMTWSVTATGACTGPGVDPTYGGQKEITLHYSTAPNHFVV